jgi:hypothetical protein
MRRTISDRRSFGSSPLALAAWSGPVKASASKPVDSPPPWLPASGAEAAVEGDVEGVEGGLPPVGPALAAAAGGFRLMMTR